MSLIVGIIVVASIALLIAIVSGAYGLMYVGLTLLIGSVAIYLTSRRSKVAKLGGYILIPEFLIKLIRPRGVSASIEELRKKENET